MKKSNVKEILEVLDVRKQNIEYVYISYSTSTKLKFIDNKTIVRQVDLFENYVIFKISINIVNKLKH